MFNSSFVITFYEFLHIFTSIFSHSKWNTFCVHCRSHTVDDWLLWFTFNITVCWMLYYWMLLNGNDVCLSKKFMNLMTLSFNWSCPVMLLKMKKKGKWKMENTCHTVNTSRSVLNTIEMNVINKNEFNNKRMKTVLIIRSRIKIVHFTENLKDLFV